MLYKITINKLRVRCVLGTNPEERKRVRDVVITITMWADLPNAARKDRVEDTLNYARLNRKVADFASRSRFRLIETLACKIGGICMDEKLISKVKVRVYKPGVPRFADGASVEVGMDREEHVDGGAHGTVMSSGKT